MRGAHPPHIHRVQTTLRLKQPPSHLLSLSLGTGTELLAGGTGRCHQSASGKESPL